jgi:hypothetical protein
MDFSSQPVDPNFQNYQMGQSSNLGFNSASALQIRLDTKPVIDEFEKYLKGIDTRIIQNDDGRLITQTVWQGKPIVNEYGHQAVMRWLNLIINTQTVQGNLIQEEDFGIYMCNLRKDIATDLMINRSRYGIAIRDFPGLMASFSNCSYLILTRTIFNKEREGMNNTTRIQETMQTQSQGGSWFSKPFFGGKK